MPFFLSPDARLWDRIRTRQSAPRLAAEVAGFAASEFIILVSSVKEAFAAHLESSEFTSYVMTDGDAAGALIRFGTGRESSARMLQALRADDESETSLDAEFLVKDAFGFERVTLIGVSNERVRDEVKALVAEAGFRARVAVYPPWFRRAEESGL